MGIFPPLSKLPNASKRIYQSNGSSGSFIVVTHRTIVRDLTSPALSLVVLIVQFIAVNRQICRAIWLARRISLNT